MPFYGLLALAGLLLALGRYTPVYGLAFHLPLLNLVRVPARWLLLSTLASTVLAPCGIDWLLEQRAGAAALWRSLRLPMLILAALGAVLLLGLQIEYMLGGHLSLQPHFSQTVVPALERLALFGGLLALVLSCRADRLIRPSIAALLLLAITLLDLWTAASGSVRFMDPSQYYGPTTVSSMLRSDAATYRVLTIDRSMPNRQGMVTGDIYDAEDFAPVTLYPYWAVSHRWAFGGAYDISNADERDLFPCYDPAADSLLGIGEITLAAPYSSQRLCRRYAGTPDLVFRSAVATEYWLLPNGTDWNPTPFMGVTYVYRNPDALPRVFLVPAPAARVIATPLDQRLAVMKSSFHGRSDLVLDPHISHAPLGFDWLQQAWADFLLPAEAPLPALRPGQSQVIADTSNSVQIALRASSPSYLVLDDTYYPGWQAYLDGKPVPIRQADYLLRAVKVPAGVHRLTFVYAPLSYLAGMSITVVTALVLAVALLWPLLRRRMRPMAGLAILPPIPPCAVMTREG